MMNPQSHPLLEVSVVTPEGILFEGNAQSVIFPGERGTFEVLPHHKPLLSRLVGGEVVVDGERILVQRGIAKVALNRVIAIVEGVSS